MLVQAECLVKAWDSAEAFMYEPGGGPLPGGLYEIDTANAPLTSMLTVGGKWVFQYDGHRGYPAKKGVQSETEPVSVTAASAPPKDKRKGKRGPMNAEQRAKLRKALADARDAKRARLEAAAA